MIKEEELMFSYPLSSKQAGGKEWKEKKQYIEMKEADLEDMLNQHTQISWVPQVTGWWFAGLSAA